MSVRYTRELLVEAAQKTSDWDDAVEWCGGKPTPGSRHYLRQKMAEAGIDTSHFTTARGRHTEARIRAVVASSSSIRAVVRALGLSPVGGNHAHISRRIAKLGIDTSHFSSQPRRRSGAGGDVLSLRSPENGRVPGERLRRAMLRSGVQERCTMCGTGPVWNSKPLRLEVDHINGGWWDNRLQNLRLLCPNCHAVTDTYRGRGRKVAT
ncbi:HNH endonuclease signature motif containing protein [Streptomyces sp. NPDC059169]|uniref:HNH endonuclease signature motif containing protein n=1 Tax=Streptomyces sp. NPDC059169 TaxID=3346754 RepID=UPI00369EDDB4